MKRKRVFALVILVSALVFVLPVSAITGGEPDDGEHPYVGMLVFYNEGGSWLWACSGSLLSDRLILTAGHCVSPDADGRVAASVRVYFDEIVAYDPNSQTFPNDGYYMGTFFPHPNWDWTLPFPETYDIGVVILDEPVVGITEFAQLPELHFLDQIANGDKRDVILTTVGYGRNDAKPVPLWYTSRYMAQSFLVSLDNWITDGWAIQTSSNPGEWDGSEEFVTGGPCSGDSGGATLFGGPESNLIVGVINAANMPGGIGKGISWRVDIPTSLDFINGVIAEYGLELP